MAAAAACVAFARVVTRWVALLTRSCEKDFWSSSSAQQSLRRWAEHRWLGCPGVWLQGRCRGGLRWRSATPRTSGAGGERLAWPDERNGTPALQGTKAGPHAAGARGTEHSTARRAVHACRCQSALATPPGPSATLQVRCRVRRHRRRRTGHALRQGAPRRPGVPCGTKKRKTGAEPANLPWEPGGARTPGPLPTAWWSTAPPTTPPRRCHSRPATASSPTASTS